DTRGSGEHVRVVYRPWILYEFEVDGDTYTGTEVDTSRINRSHPNHSEVFLEQYSEDSTIEIHYDPDNPDNCIFRPEDVPADPGADGCLLGTIFNMLFWVLALGIGFIFVWVVLRNKLGYDLPPLSVELVENWLRGLFYNTF
ncbi:MAG: hypothetical protein ABEK50_13245, partial [bacterium]